MALLLHSNTIISYNGSLDAVKYAAGILRRDFGKRFHKTDHGSSTIQLITQSSLDDESFIIDVTDRMVISSKDELGFVYGLLYVSEKFLGIHPFWFWMDQKIQKVDAIPVSPGRYCFQKPSVKYRGWFVNDEVLITKWKIGGDSIEPWRMVFEALLRCGGNMVIPGTDKNSRKYRQIAAGMGLWITHHHAEPLGAEMFARVYPDKEPNYAKMPELFHKLWEDGIKEQKDFKVIWTLGFRGQGDCPFWSNDSSGRFDTPEKRGKLISDIIEFQRQLVMKYVKNPIFCTNLYGEIMELYKDGHITLAEDIIKISADNGYGKMVTRRRDNHTVRIPSIPEKPVEHGGIYYHVSFYDLQAANHITMLPNSVDFVNKELEEVFQKNATDYWIINCSNVRPHVYYLDALRKKWFGSNISDLSHSREFADTYFNGNPLIAEAYQNYHKAMASYGAYEDEHAGEQFYTENVRLLVHSFFNESWNGTPGLKWLVGEHPLDVQVQMFADLCRGNLDSISKFYRHCLNISNSLNGEEKSLFDATLLLHAAIHYHCTAGSVSFGEGYKEYRKGNLLDSFMKLGSSAEAFDTAQQLMRNSEYGVWTGFYFNDCFADIKHTAYMVEKMMGYVRERGDNARHDKWYRDAVYSPEDIRIFTQLVEDNHMTDRELYKAYLKKKGDSNSSLLF